ncbi:acyl-CoA dehydrogenase family protein [Rhodococcus coprophilus]|uniref:Acyl-CoA oxidase n=1 Tax=Rhodococcus coprophilus TaxID=38310 RepID=A0A2X4U2T5_9NOCA|nr:acyl-CoA dehydrogenase [Rhodococcus coprophilus]MBM7460775.1 acyl-CoA oxidase [Rhodococcus coprophilus]SQI28582.1 acyl-CoA oxidase [Rhodococcus coprophilus]
MTLDSYVELCFDGRYNDVHRPVRALLTDEIFDPRAGLTANENGRLAYERARFVGRHSVRPTAAASDIYQLCALAEWPGLCDVSVFSILMVHYNLMVATVVDRMRPNEYVTPMLAELDEFKSFGPYLATELGYGNNVANLQTTATYDAETREFVLHTPGTLASKHMSYSGFSDIPKIAVVLARTIVGGRDHGVFPFLVRLTTTEGAVAGIRTAACPEKPVQGLDNGITQFEEHRVPEQAWLSRGLATLSADGEFVAEMANPRRRFLASMSRIFPGRLCVSSAALGASKAALYIALRFSSARLTSAPGSKPRAVRAHLPYRAQLYPAVAITYALTAQLNALKARYEVNPTDLALQTEISATKAVITLVVQDIVMTCRERCGAQGIFAVNRIIDYISLVQGLVTAEGDSQVLLATAAGQQLASDHEQIDPSAHPVRLPVLELLARRTDLAAKRYHETRASEDAATTAFDGINQAAPIALDFGRFWILERSIETLLDRAASLADAHAQDVILRIAELVAVSELVRDPLDLMADGAVQPDVPAQWRDRIFQLCDHLDPEIDQLIGAFGFTPELLRAPIAEADYATAFLNHCVGTATTAFTR